MKSFDLSLEHVLFQLTRDNNSIRCGGQQPANGMCADWCVAEHPPYGNPLKGVVVHCRCHPPPTPTPTHYCYWESKEVIQHPIEYPSSSLIIMTITMSLFVSHFISLWNIIVDLYLTSFCLMFFAHSLLRQFFKREK